MFTEKKFSSLDITLRCRKAVRILKDTEDAMHKGCPADCDYISMILRIALEEPELTLENRQGFLLLREINRYKYKLMEKAGIQVADWNMILDVDNPDAVRHILPIEVYLEDLRSPFNVGSIFRSAESFGFSKILLSPDTPTPDHPRAKRSAMGTDTIISWEVCPPEYLAGKNIFALETGGTPIDEFDFPKDGIMILGSEETGISPQLLDMAKKSMGIVSIQMLGKKRSINVGVAFGIAASLWSRKLTR